MYVCVCVYVCVRELKWRGGDQPICVCVRVCVEKKGGKAGSVSAWWDVFVVCVYMSFLFVRSSFSLIALINIKRVLVLFSRPSYHRHQRHRKEHMQYQKSTPNPKPTEKKGTVGHRGRKTRRKTGVLFMAFTQFSFSVSLFFWRWGQRTHIRKQNKTKPSLA